MSGVNSIFRSISTAPKDGTWILLRGGTVNCWHNSNKPPAVVGMWVEPDEDDDDEGWWGFSSWDGNIRGSYKNPTSWMPLD